MFRVAILILCLFLTGCQKQFGGGQLQELNEQYRGSIDAIPADKLWGYYFSRGMPKLFMTPVADGGFTFDFPTYAKTPTNNCVNELNCPLVGYVLKRVNKLEGEKLTMQITIDATGSVVFNGLLEPGNQCAQTPASVRLFFQRKDDDLDSDYYRWWSNPYTIVLKAGKSTLTVPLAPENWSSVFGQNGNANDETREGFSAAKEEAEKVGFTFGGGCFFGHGVNISGGTAKFTLNKFMVE